MYWVIELLAKSVKSMRTERESSRPDYLSERLDGESIPGGIETTRARRFVGGESTFCSILAPREMD